MSDGRNAFPPRTWIEVEARRIIPGDLIDDRLVRSVLSTAGSVVANVGVENFTYVPSAYVTVARKDADCDA